MAKHLAGEVTAARKQMVAPVKLAVFDSVRTKDTHLQDNSISKSQSYRISQIKRFIPKIRSLNDGREPDLKVF